MKLLFSNVSLLLILVMAEPGIAQTESVRFNLVVGPNGIALGKTDLDPRIGKINIAPQEIGRVMLNLKNDVFFADSQRKISETPGAEHREPTVRIKSKKLNARPDDPVGRDKVVVSVSDNGTGIPMNVLDKIFQPFFTTKSTGEGTGLGLSLSYDIITKGHDGEIKVDTIEGQGTTFTIILPV